MSTADEVLQRIAAREADPEWQAQQRKEREQREKDGRRARAAAQQEALLSIGLPGKDVDLLRTGKVEKTRAILALEMPAVLIVLSGGTGTGKTTATSWWLWGWHRDPANWPEVSEWGTQPKCRGSAVFVTAAALARWGRYNEAEMDTILRATLLAIDDLGSEYLDTKGAYLSLLDEIVNERYANRRPTVLTTNLNVNDFRERYGERIADRIRESGRFEALGDDSMRGGEGKAGKAGKAHKQETIALVRPPAKRAVGAPEPDRRLPRERDDDE